MGTKPELLVMKGAAVLHRQELGDRPLNIGRGPSNGLVLIDDHVSWLHAVIWIERGRIWLKDLGSTNGTFVNNKRLREPLILAEGAAIKLGPQVELRVSGGANRAPSKSLMLEDLSSGLRFPIQRDRFHIGSGEDCDLRVESIAPRAGTLIIHENDEVWLGADEDDVLLQIGEVFEFAGRSLRLHEIEANHAPTATGERALYPYRLTVTLQGATGPEARVEELRQGISYTVDAANRAILLYLLVRKWAEDADADVADRGWCGDEEIASGIWGRNWREQASNHLHVLVHRLRKELKGVGFDPWFIEKRKRCIRARIQEGLIE